MNKHEKVLFHLKQAKDGIISLLTEPEDQNHVIKLTTELQRSHDYYSLVTATGEAGQEAIQKLGPAKTIGGKKIEYKANMKPEDVKPDEFRMANLKRKVEALHAAFLTTDSVDILKNYEDTVIRGVAKKAKMKGINKENPPTLTLEFIEDIKLEITIENERLAKLAGGTPAIKSELIPEPTGAEGGAKVLTTGDDIDDLLNQGGESGTDLHKI